MFRLTVEKFDTWGAYFWTNIYWCNVSGPSGQGALVDAVVAAERALYTNFVQITKARIDDAVPNTDNFSTYVKNLLGTRTGTLTPLPGWIVGRVDFSTATGRPSRKYLRRTLHEEDISGLSIVAGALTLLQTYGNAIIAIPEILDPDQQPFVAAAPFNGAQMRQLRRGSKRVVTP